MTCQGRGKISPSVKLMVNTFTPIYCVCQSMFHSEEQFYHHWWEAVGTLVSVWALNGNMLLSPHQDGHGQIKMEWDIGVCTQEVGHNSCITVGIRKKE